ncbi:MAG: hypothetical protein LQ341_001042 [Variospora aurantia]|nr:MAG: hypothetical protein LQ341_001042 [Variospora aurantia]
MEPENHDAAQSRRYDAAESMLQHARMPRTQQSGLNGFPKTYPLGGNSSQQLNHMPAIPHSPYPNFTMPIHHPRAGQAHVYNTLLDGQLDSRQDASPRIDQSGQHLLSGQPQAFATVSCDNDTRQLANRSLHMQHEPLKRSDLADNVEPGSPVSSRGFASKEVGTKKRSMRTLGQKPGKKGSVIKHEEDKPPPWSELKTKAGKERKRLPLACIACRRKKIRCSGEKPACKHCFRSRTPCVYKVTTRKAAPRTDYMAMLDKRLKRMEERVIKLIPEDEASGIATTGRAQVRPPASGHGIKTLGAKKRAADEAFGPDPAAWASFRMSKAFVQGRGTGQTAQPAEGSDKLPSKEIQEHLAGVYFECLYGQSYLLLHKPSFMKRLRFSTHPQISSEPAFLRGEEWAAPAREIAMKRYDQPSITILTVFLILGLHEFGTCQGGRSWMFGGMAMRMAYALQLHRELDYDPKLSATDREIRRRIMWACFMMDRFNSSGTERPTCGSEDHYKIQLPTKEFNFQHEVPGPTETLNAGNFNPASLEAGSKVNPSDNMGVAAYVVRVIALWGRVIRYLNLGGKEEDRYELWHPESEFGALKRQAEEFKVSLPSELQYSADNLATQATENLGNQFLFLHISYYQVVLFLHRYSIPMTPGAMVANDIPRGFLSASAQTAVEAADRISELIRHASDNNVYAPFVGYCAFTSSTVHISNTFSNQPRLRASAQRNLGVNLEFIRRMKRYWGMYHFLDDNLGDVWQKHRDYASRKSTGAGEEVREPDASLFQYGDWFQKYPHGVSETDYEDPAIAVKEEGIKEATSQKTHVRGAEDFFDQTLPPRPPQLYRKHVRKPPKPAPFDSRLHPPQVLPQDVPLEALVQSMVPMAPQIPVDASPFSPLASQTLYSTIPAQTYDILGETSDMNLLPNSDRNLPSIQSTGAPLQRIATGDQTTGTWEQVMGGANAQAQAQAMEGMGSYMGDFQQSSAWVMPFNMPPLGVFFGDGQDGYLGYGMGRSGGDGGGGDQ